MPCDSKMCALNCGAEHGERRLSFSLAGHIGGADRNADVQVLATLTRKWKRHPSFPGLLFPIRNLTAFYLKLMTARKRVAQQPEKSRGGGWSCLGKRRLDCPDFWHRFCCDNYD